MTHTPNKPGTKDSTQNLQNWSFDKDFNVFAFENLVHNPVDNTMDRVSGIPGNGSFVLDYTDGNLTKVTKTIGAKSYEKTLTWTDGNLTAVSVWSAV